MRLWARFSPLNSGDLGLFRAALAGEHAIRGFRNADITRRLYPQPAADRDDARRRCERTSRLIVKFRGRGGGATFDSSVNLPVGDSDREIGCASVRS